MPTTTLAYSALPAYRLFKSDHSSQVLSGSYVTVNNTITKPIPYKRAKPNDLFAGGTAREVRSQTMSCTYGSTDNDPDTPNWGTITLAPMTYWSGGISSPCPVPDTSKIDSKLRAQIKDSNLNLAQSLAEYRQTSDLFVSGVKDVVGIIRGIRSGKAGKKLLKALKQPIGVQSKRVANRWLQLQYGIRPLMSDIYGSAEALAKVLDEGSPRYVKVKHTSSQQTTSVTSLFVVSTKIDTTITGRARYTISSAAVKQLSEVGITNPALLAWELIPYSFVIDWFVNVGDFLSSLDAMAGVTNLVVQKGYYVESMTTKSGRSGKGLFMSSPYGICKETLSYRFPTGTSVPLPTLRYEPSLNLTKMLNAAALIRQLR